MIIYLLKDLIVKNQVEIYFLNYQDLQNKVEKFLTELISQINKKYCECPTCKGWGIIEGE